MSSFRPRITIVDCGSNKVPMLARCLDDLGSQLSIVRPVQLASSLDTGPAAVVISGNPALILDSGTDFLADFETLLEWDRPLLGICFGHQVIGLLHGADVSMGREDRGLRRIDVVQQSDLFNDLATDCSFQEDHIEVVSLPSRFTLLATSSRCDNEAMVHNERPIYGVQFHPESSGAAGRQLLANFLSMAATA